MRERSKEEILDEQILDNDLLKTADNYQPDPSFEELGEERPVEPERNAILGLWEYTEDDPYPQMPIFEGTFEECASEAERIASEFGFHPVSDDSVIGRHWSNDQGDSLMIQ